MCPIGDGDAVKLSEGILDRAVVGAGDYSIIQRQLTRPQTPLRRYTHASTPGRVDRIGCNK